MNTRKLSFEEIEKIEGSSDCGWAIAGAVGVTLAIVAVSIWAPAAWLRPRTWLAAGTLVAGSLYLIDSECGSPSEW